jgi:hypothetical protein
MPEGLATSAYNKAKDTLESLGIQEPLPVEGLGTIFWAESYSHGSDVNTGVDPIDFSKMSWTTHYSIPQYGNFAFELKLGEPLKNTGFENVGIRYNSVMGFIERDYSQDFNQHVPIGDLQIPRALIKYMEKVLIEWCGEALFIEYNCTPVERGDNTAIRIEFDDCQKIPFNNPDMILQSVAKDLSRTMAMTIE